MGAVAEARFSFSVCGIGTLFHDLGARWVNLRNGSPTIENIFKMAYKFWAAEKSKLIQKARCGLKYTFRELLYTQYNHKPTLNSI